LPAELKRARGTLRPSRQKDVIEITTPLDPPIEPSWLTEDGRAAWLDNVGRVMQTGFAREVDSDLFALFCNLLGGIARAWTLGEAPPAWAAREARLLAELFGLAGEKSRIVRGLSPATPGAGNPFDTNKPVGQ
jgi:hypothetical protein